MITCFGLPKPKFHLSTSIPARMALATLRNFGFSLPWRLTTVAALDRLKSQGQPVTHSLGQRPFPHDSTRRHPRQGACEKKKKQTIIITLIGVMRYIDKKNR